MMTTTACETGIYKAWENSKRLKKIEDTPDTPDDWKFADWNEFQILIRDKYKLFTHKELENQEIQIFQEAKRYMQETTQEYRNGNLQQAYKANLKAQISIQEILGIMALRNQKFNLPVTQEYLEATQKVVDHLQGTQKSLSKQITANNQVLDEQSKRNRESHKSEQPARARRTIRSARGQENAS